MISLNMTLVVQVLQFLLLVIVLNRLLFKPTVRVLDERNQRIAAQEQTAKDLQEQIRTKVQTYEAEISAVKRSCWRQQEEGRQQAAAEAARAVAAAEAEAKQLVDRVQQELRREAEKVRAEIQAQADELAALVAARVLGREAR